MIISHSIEYLLCY